MRISWIEPKCENVFCSSSSERPLAMPPQYTVQLVGLDWLYTSSKVKGLEFAAKKEEEKCHIELGSQKKQLRNDGSSQGI